MRALLVVILLLGVFAWMGAESLESWLTIQRLEAQTEADQARALADLAAAQKAQAQALERSTAANLTLSLALAVWGLLLGVGGLLVAVLALKGRPAAPRLVDPYPYGQPVRWPMPVQRPMTENEVERYG